MKSDQINGSIIATDPIWSNNEELLPSEECLPIIGSCQVSSILQNLDPAQNEHNNLQSMDLIILNGNDYKLPLHTSGYIVLKDSIAGESCSGTLLDSNGRNGNIISTDTFPQQSLEKFSEKLFYKQKEDENEGPTKRRLSNNKTPEPTDLSLNITDTSNSSNTSSTSPKHYDKESFEDMLYFVCNLCPFLCTKETRITEHLESVHKNKTLSKLVQLKCPACANVFYHRASLKSHLLHDHCVASNDLNLIVQAVIFYSNKENKKDDVQRQTEEVVKAVSSKISEKLCDNNNKAKVKGNEVAAFLKPNINVEANLNTGQKKLIKRPQKIPLPQVDITANDSEKLITNLMKTADEPIVKYINSQKCAYASCKVLLSDAKKMDYHVGCHFEASFKCRECDEKFACWKPLTSHLWRLHKIDMELYGCDKCDYKTNSLSKLNTVHKLIHGTVKAFQCDICQKFFKNQKQLRNHRRIHRDNTDKESESCELCQKCFSDKRRLRNHMDSVHKKLKPFLCNFCGYKGSSRASLKMHIRSHTGEKPFSCDQCQYSTADHNSLRRHKLRHSGGKPYKCSYCSYACIQSSTYKAHLKTKHPGMEKDLMFTCFMCQFKTVNKEMYNSHLVTVHEQKSSVELD